MAKSTECSNINCKTTFDPTEDNKKLESHTLTYHRNKVSSVYYFCCEECKDIFNRTLKCWECGYNSKLKYIEEEDYSLCTDYPNTQSCYDKHENGNFDDVHCRNCSAGYYEIKKYKSNETYPCIYMININNKYGTEMDSIYMCQDCYHGSIIKISINKDKDHHSNQNNSIDED
jgi:hypothetical protein